MSVTYSLAVGDALRTGLADQSVDLVLGSPPYEAQRTYSIGFNLKGQAWVDWMVAGFREWLRICRGPVIMVAEGFTKDFAWSASPALLMADLHRAGITLRKPPAYHRVGIPGSGGPDWLRNDYEFCIVATNGGKLPWSDNTAMGHTPKWAPGGEMSNRHADGKRVNAQLSQSGNQKRNGFKNQWGEYVSAAKMGERKADGQRQTRLKPSDQNATALTVSASGKICGKSRRANGEMKSNGYPPPVKANPGNVIKEIYTPEEIADMARMILAGGDVTKHIVGGGVMGHKLAHENEAPFPETLADFFIRSFCPPGGIVCDTFVGSGTTVAAAIKAGRSGIGFDIRPNMIDISRRRLIDVAAQLSRGAA